MRSLGLDQLVQTDIICGSNNQALRNRLFKHLIQQWKITDEGVLKRFVGLNFERSEDGLTGEASCGPYIDKIAKRFKVDPKIQETPTDAEFAVMPEDLGEEHSVEKMGAMEAEFRSMIVSLVIASRDDTLGHCLQHQKMTKCPQIRETSCGGLQTPVMLPM